MQQSAAERRHGRPSGFECQFHSVAKGSPRGQQFRSRRYRRISGITHPLCSLHALHQFIDFFGRRLALERIILQEIVFCQFRQVSDGRPGLGRQDAWTPIDRDANRSRHPCRHRHHPWHRSICFSLGCCQPCLRRPLFFRLLCKLPLALFQFLLSQRTQTEQCFLACWRARDRWRCRLCSGISDNVRRFIHSVNMAAIDRRIAAAAKQVL